MAVTKGMSRIGLLGCPESFFSGSHKFHHLTVFAVSPYPTHAACRRLIEQKTDGPCVYLFADDPATTQYSSQPLTTKRKQAQKAERNGRAVLVYFFCPMMLLEAEEGATETNNAC